MAAKLMGYDSRLVYGGAIVAGLAVAWLVTRNLRDTAKNAAQGVVGIAEGTITGVVVGVGEAVGIPETNQDQCTADLAAGRTWDASFSCPAGTFLKSLFN